MVFSCGAANLPRRASDGTGNCREPSYTERPAAIVCAIDRAKDLVTAWSDSAQAKPRNQYKVARLGSAGDGDIGEAAIDKVGVDIGVHVHQHAVSSEFLGSLSAKDLTGLLNLA